MAAIEDPHIAKWSEDLAALQWPDDAGEQRELLVALCDRDEATRESALTALIDSVLSEERIEAASVQVAEQLLALLALDAAPDKDQLLVAIDALGDSASALLEASELADEGDDAFDPAELEVALDLRAAVVQGSAAIVALLDAEDEDTRVCAPFALTVPLSARPREISEALLARLADEQQPRVRASLLLALGLSGQSPVIEEIRRSLEQGDSAIERVAAAMALIPFFGKLVQDEAILTLIDALAEPDELRLIYSELPWADDDLVVDLAALLASFNEGARCPVLPPLYERLDGCQSRGGVLALVEAALIIAFDALDEHEHDDDDHDHGASAVELTALSRPQRELLARLEKDDRLWSSAPIGGVLGEYGLPATREQLRATLRS